MPVGTRVRRPVQHRPGPQARALPTHYGLADERAWVRTALATEYAAAEAEVAGLLARHPGFRPGADTLADAVAVRMYLGALGDGLAAALRTGQPGPHVPFGRCVAAGLARLPAYRGATVLAAGLTPDEMGEIREHRVLTDWGFTEALTEAPAALPAGAGVLIWSLTARRTRLLEPGDDHRAADRVVFPPGTSFKVLPPDGYGRLLLRELAPDEPSPGFVPFDDFSATALHRAVEQWRLPGPVEPVGPAARHRFTVVPGLLPS